MFQFLARDKERQRYYLLPGMGGRALRAKRKMMLIWSISAGLVVSGLFGFLLWYFSKNPQL